MIRMLRIVTRALGRMQYNLAQAAVYHQCDGNRDAMIAHHAGELMRLMETEATEAGEVTSHVMIEVNDDGSYAVQPWYKSEVETE